VQYPLHPQPQSLDDCSTKHGCLSNRRRSSLAEMQLMQQTITFFCSPALMLEL
jgi:hypothetical protein